MLAERLRDINPEIRLHELPMYVEAPLLSPQGGKLQSEQEDENEFSRDVITPSALLDKLSNVPEMSSPHGGNVGGRLFIVDAIDTIAPKCALLGEALRRGIPIVSSMGAGAKSDITQIRFADLWDTYHCGLAKAVRTRLKKEGLRRSLPVVFSTEQADRRAVITVEGEQNKKSTAGTISYMPAVFGCYLAEYVIRKL